MHAKFGAWSIGLALWLAAGVSLGNSAVQWHSSLERAQVAAAHTNRLVLVHFWGNGCPPCAWMEREVFSRPDVAQAIDQGFVAVKVNKDQFPNLARQFGVAAVPTDIFITPQGQVVASYVGKAPAAEFVNRLAQVAGRVTPPPAARDYAFQGTGPANQAIGNNPGYPPQQPAAQPPQAPGAYGMNGPIAGRNPSIPPYPQQRTDQALAAEVTPRYSDQYAGNSNGPAFPGADPNGAQMGMPGANPNSSQYGMPVANPDPHQFGMPSGQGMTPGMAMAPQAADPYAANPQLPPSGANGAMPGQAPTQQVAAGPVQENPPLALEGFCPVSLERSMRLDPQPKWIPGDPRWGLRHEGRTYLFAGPEEQQAFFSNPDLYAPVISGNDVVLLVEQGTQVPGVREFGARWRNRVYLFSGRESYERFQANPAHYENEVLRPQPVAGPARASGQEVGAAVNPSHGYR